MCQAQSAKRAVARAGIRVTWRLLLLPAEGKLRYEAAWRALHRRGNEATRRTEGFMGLESVTSMRPSRGSTPSCNALSALQGGDGPTHCTSNAAAPAAQS